MRYFLMCLLLGVLMVSAALAQSFPQGTHVEFYFPQIADGGDAGGQWQTTFIFSNLDKLTTASITLNFFKGDGSGLPIDFGSGAASRQNLTVPPGGIRVFRSTGTSGKVNTGWALAESSIPIQATASYRQSVEGFPKLDVSVYPTLPTIQFSSPASRLYGYALANVHVSSPITVEMEIRNSEGTRLADPIQINLQPLSYQAAYVYEKFPNVPDFAGTLSIKAVSTFPRSDEFIAMTLSSDETGIWSGLPSGAFSQPLPDYSRIQLVYRNILNAARANGYLASSPQLSVVFGTAINARASSDGATIEVALGLSQLLGDSDSELAFVVAHAFGHVYQLTHGLTHSLDKELDADVLGILVALAAEYDPYAAAGALGKLDLASGSMGLIGQSFDDIANPHASFSARLDNLNSSINSACNANSNSRTACNDFRKKFHPNFPSVPNMP